MKYRILYLIALFAMFSCSEHFEGKYSIDKGLETIVSVVIPQLPNAHPQSRVMGLNPDLKNLKLAVFDDNGYLLEYVSATEVQLATQNETTYGYKVQLRPTDFPTYIHFIGNAPENIQYGTETEAIGRLFTEGGNEAYWQRIELPKGIKKNGDTFDESVTSALTNVRLVRNYAWIQLENTATNFKIDSYCVVNTYRKGSIAPYNTSLGEFADFANQQTHADLLSEGYNGFIPAGAELDKTIPDEDAWFKPQTGQSADSYAYFIYEREKALSDSPFILVKGEYKPDSGSPMTRYYKVDLRDQDGNYFPLIRNFRYKVRITKVMNEGHATAKEAADGSGSGDVSTANETEDYTNISNGVARIFVSYTDTTLVAQTDELKLRYKFMVFKTTDASGNVLTNEQILNDNVNIATQGEVIDDLVKSNTNASDGWREITISTTALGAMSKSQDIIIKGAVTIDEKLYELQRKVTITLTPKYTMQLVCDPTEIVKEQGTPFDVVIKVPGALRPDMFPLDIKLEASNQSMTPDQGDDLPVVTGKSIVPGKETKTTIGFIKQIQYDDYDALPLEGGYKSVICHFKSNKAESATPIYADNKYFNQASTVLGNYVPGTFSNLVFNPSSNLTAGGNAAFSFSMSEIPASGEVYVTLDGLEKADGENRLVWDSGKGCYKYMATSTSGSFNLTCIGTKNPASVKLSAYHFKDAEEEINVQLNSFTDLTFNPTSVTTGVIGESVTFSFNMANMPNPADVTVTLYGLEPNNDSKLTYVKTNEDDSKQYKYTPSSTGNQTFNLKTTIENGQASVKLEAGYYNTAQKALNVSMRYVIPAGNIKVGNVTQEITLYVSEPDWWGNNQSLGISFTPTGNNNNKQNGEAIEISAENYQRIMEDGNDTIYLRYSTSVWTYYITSISLSKLLDGTAGTLTFSEQDLW